MPLHQAPSQAAQRTQPEQRWRLSEVSICAGAYNDPSGYASSGYDREEV
jgi:hypothetical protein